MARQLVGQRKGAPTPGGDERLADRLGKTAMSDGPDGRLDGEESPDDSDVVKCPNCACEFNEETLDVVKPGKPVEGGSDGPEGVDLETPQHPVPGRMGAAHDAAVGDSVMSSLLAGLKGSMGGAR